MSKVCGFVLVIFNLLNLSGCYDGWESRNNGSGTTPPPTPPSETKTIYNIQFVPIYLSTAATTSGTCFGASGTESYRITEWKERRDRIMEKLNLLSASVELAAIEISSSDCTLLSAVETASLSSTSLESLPDDPLDRPIVQLKAVFWDGDVNGTFSQAVTREDWTTVRTIRLRGRKVLSLAYFSLSNQTVGRFSSWWVLLLKGLHPSRVLNANPIDAVDPTSAGEEVRTTTARDDANTLATWILTEITKI